MQIMMMPLRYIYTVRSDLYIYTSSSQRGSIEIDNNSRDPFRRDQAILVHVPSSELMVLYIYGR